MSRSRDFSSSAINLTGIGAGQVLFNFPNASAITLNKAENQFRGTILAPLGTVEYHNPAVFEGAIIAHSIYLHSDFNMTFVPFEYHDDPRATRRSVESLLALPFTVLCLAHGAPVVDDPKGAIRELLGLSG